MVSGPYGGPGWWKRWKSANCGWGDVQVELWQDGSRVRECGNQYIIMPGRHHMPATVAHQATLCHTMPLTNTNARLPTYSVPLYIHYPHQTVLNFWVFFCNTIGLCEKVLLNQISQFLVVNKIFQKQELGSDSPMVQRSQHVLFMAPLMWWSPQRAQ